MAYRLQDPPKEVDIDEIIDPVKFAAPESHASDDAPSKVCMSDHNLLKLPYGLASLSLIAFHLSIPQEKNLGLPTHHEVVSSVL